MLNTRIESKSFKKLKNKVSSDIEIEEGFEYFVFRGILIVGNVFITKTKKHEDLGMADCLNDNSLERFSNVDEINKYFFENSVKLGYEVQFIENQIKYEIVKKDSVKKITPYYEVFIEGDWNDADYVSSVDTYNQEQFNEVVFQLVILNSDPMDGEYGLDYSKYDMLSLPSGYPDGCGLHTITEIRVKYFDKNNICHDVEFF